MKSPLYLLALAGTLSAAELTVQPAPFQATESFPATVWPENTAPLKLDAKVWREFEIVKIAAHGTPLNAGDVIATFERKDFTRKLEDTKRAAESARLAAAQAALEQDALKQSSALQLDGVRRADRNAAEALEYFQKVKRKAAEEGATEKLKRVQFALEGEQEELAQLLKMYEADDVTEETEEIILKRQRHSVASAEFALRMTQLETDRTIKVELPREEEQLTSAAKQAKLTREKTEQESERKIAQKQLELDAANAANERAKADLTELEGDAKWFELKAPVAGGLFYGTLEDGRWSGAAEAAKGIFPGARIAADRVFAGIAPTAGNRSLVAYVDAKNTRALANGTNGRATLGGREELDIPVKVAAIAALPAIDGRHRIDLQTQWPDKQLIAPLATLDVKLFTYAKADALSVPNNALYNTATGWEVEVKLADGKTGRRPVQIGRLNGQRTEIVSGLEAGQVVIYPDK